MDFYGDPFAEQLNTLHEFFRWWAWSNHERKKTGINVLYPLMMSVRSEEEVIKNLEKKVKENTDPRRGLTLGLPTRVPPVEKHLIARKIDKIINDPELWHGHYSDRLVLVCFYLDKTANTRGCGQSVRHFSKAFKVPHFRVKPMVRTALIYFSSLWANH